MLLQGAGRLSAFPWRNGGAHQECNYNNTLPQHNVFATTAKKPAGVVEVPANKDALKQALAVGPVMGNGRIAVAEHPRLLARHVAASSSLCVLLLQC